MYREEIGRGCGWRPRYVPSDTFANPEPIVTTHSLGLPHGRFEFGAVAVTRPLQARDAPEILRNTTRTSRPPNAPKPGQGPNLLVTVARPGHNIPNHETSLLPRSDPRRFVRLRRCPGTCPPRGEGREDQEVARLFHQPRGVRQLLPEYIAKDAALLEIVKLPRAIHFLFHPLGNHRQRDQLGMRMFERVVRDDEALLTKAKRLRSMRRATSTSNRSAPPRRRSCQAVVWEARHGNSGSIPRIDSPVVDNSIGRVLLMVIGSIPFWLALILVTSPPPPSAGQLFNTVIVAVFSGVIATSLFLHARHHAKTSYELAAVDATQSTEVIFSLLGEIVFLHGSFPGIAGSTGIVLVLAGLILYLRAQTADVKSCQDTR